MEGDVVLWAAVIGLLIGIIWALRYIIKLDHRQMDLNQKIESLLSRKLAKASEPKKKK